MSLTACGIVNIVTREFTVIFDFSIWGIAAIEAVVKA
jgi:hypothetical protein